MFLATYDHGGYILWGPHFEERFHSAVEWLDRYPSFKIGLDNESFAYDKYSESDPKIIATMKDALKKYGNRLDIGSTTYGQPLSVFISEESNVRQLVYAVRANLKHFGQTPSVYAISEHALHSQIPQLAAQSGYIAAVMRTHFMMYGYNPTYNVGYGTWIGEDGTEIPTVPTYEGQGAEFAITTMDNWVLTRWPDETDVSIEDFAEKFTHITPLLASRYDDIILRCEKLVAHTEGNPNYKWITLEEVPALFGEPQDKFKPEANEFVVRMPWGYCGNVIFNGCRKAETSVALAERVNAFSVLMGGKAMEKELEQAWKDVLITQHHDIQICGLMGDYHEYIPKSLKASEGVIQASLKTLSASFKQKSLHSLLVVNTNSWKIGDVVEREISYPRGSGPDEIGVFLNEQPVPCEITVYDRRRHDTVTRARVRFKAEVGALSAACFSIEPIKGLDFNLSDTYDPATSTLFTDHYTVKFDEYGIRSIKSGDKTVVDGAKGSLFAGIIDGEAQVSKGSWNVVCKGASSQAEFLGYIGTIGLRFVMEFFDEVVHCRVQFWHNGEQIGSTIQTEEFKKNTNGFVHEDKLRFILNTNLEDKANAVRDLPFHISGTDDKYVQGNYWTSVSDDKIGLAYFNRGAMCMVREGSAFSLPLAYSGEYVWGNRYLYGEHSHEFALFLFTGAADNVNIHHKALEYQYPLLTMPIDGENEGKIDGALQFMETDCEGAVILSALYPEDGHIMARLYECAGRTGRAYPKGPFAENITEVNLLGEAIESTGKEFTPWKIKTWKLGTV